MAPDTFCAKALLVDSATASRSASAKKTRVILIDIISSLLRRDGSVNAPHASPIFRPTTTRRRQPGLDSQLFPLILHLQVMKQFEQPLKQRGRESFLKDSTKAGKSCNHTLVRQPNRCALTLSRRGRSWDWRRFLAPDRRCGRSMTVMRATREFSIVNV